MWDKVGVLPPHFMDDAYVRLGGLLQAKLVAN